MPWSEVRNLWADGFLSFDPDAAGALDEAREAELTFLGAMAAAGLPHDVLRVMLRGLRRPYAYDLRCVFYDWIGCRWRPLPDDADPEGAFFALLQRLESKREREVLISIRDFLEDALDLERDRGHFFTHEDDRGSGGPQEAR